ncbi:ScbA/BarX family gamma-butyrolactone biosynthesis protein [Streptomyces sp. G45]|uniref:ScbA/BarX family gamma-butyrolactone biosynthesis protein n=1 Tax=Streptomyces sp. G45 TaxID=3406627 RepID=UPI003C2A7E68
MVRKTVPSEILITGWSRLSGTTHRLTATWPQDHPFYIPRADRSAYSPQLFTETVRQALSLLTNTAHGIPLAYRLGWEYSATTVNPSALRVGSDPEVQLTVDLTVPDLRPTRRTVKLAARIRATRGGEPLGAAHIRYSAHAPALYDRLRGRYADAKACTAAALPPSAPLPSAVAGRARAHDVVLSHTSEPYVWRLRVDPGHAQLFDHPHDHVPGLLMLEAAHQAAQCMAGPDPITPTTTRTQFDRYVELDAPCLVRATPLAWPHPDVGHTSLVGTQRGRTVFTTELVTRR